MLHIVLLVVVCALGWRIMFSRVGACLFGLGAFLYVASLF